MLKEVQNTVLCTYFVNDCNGEDVIQTFYRKKTQKTNEQGFRTEWVIKKVNKLYAKWKRYNNSFNSWIDKEDLIEWNSLV